MAFQPFQRLPPVSQPASRPGADSPESLGMVDAKPGRSDEYEASGCGAGANEPFRSAPVGHWKSITGGWRQPSMRGGARGATAADEFETMKNTVATLMEDFKELAMASRTTSVDMQALRQETDDQRMVIEGLAGQRQSVVVDAESRLASWASREVSLVSDVLEEKLVAGFHEVESRFARADARERGLSTRVKELEQSLTEAKAQLVAQATAQWASIAALLRNQADAFEASLAKLRADVHDRLAETVDGMEEKMATMSGVHEELLSGQKSMAGLNDKLEKAMVRMMSQRSDALEQLMIQHRGAVGADFAKLQRDTSKQLSTFAATAQQLKHACSSMECMPTRRVEWVVRNARDELRRLPQDGAPASWFSPKFEAAGANDLRLELRRSARVGTAAAEAEAGGRQRCVEGTGEAASPTLPDSQQDDCELLLWSTLRGLHLVCKLSVGTASSEVAHTFDGVQPVSSGTLGSALDLVDQQQGTLRIGIDIHEVIRKVPQSQEVDEDYDTCPARPLGSIESFRYLNHRAVDVMRQQVGLMQSRLVRRVEWRIESASSLRRFFPEGETLCSAQFDAAGVPELQLVFYPSGHRGAKEGHCSFFLHCPLGCTMRCFLSAGRQRKEAKCTSDGRRGYCGRTNFCRLDQCADPDDTILLAVDIEEARQTATEAFLHEPPATARSRGLESPPPAGAPAAGGAGPPEDERLKFGSSLKVQKCSAGATLEDVRQLPAMWSPRPLSDPSRAPMVFHPFADLRIVPPGPMKALSARARALCTESAGSAPGPARYAMYV